MRVFFSHASHYKPLVREVRAALPGYIESWVDEDRLLIGEDIAESLERVITNDTDFVVLFVDKKAVESAWVRREVEWALGTEKRLGRSFVLPIVFDYHEWERFEPAEFRKRKYIAATDFSGKAFSSSPTRFQRR